LGYTLLPNRDLMGLVRAIQRLGVSTIASRASQQKTQTACKHDSVLKLFLFRLQLDSA
jgi:hypothetical protein